MPTLDLHIEVPQAEDCSSFTFKDTTAIFDPINSPNGYDVDGISAGAAVDPADLDLSTVTIEVTLPDGTIVTITPLDTEFDPDNIGTHIPFISHVITATDLGMTDTITDGVYKFTYTLLMSDGSASYSATCYVLTTCLVCCCIARKLVDITMCSDCSNPKKNKRVNDLMYAHLLVAKAQHLLTCNNFTGAQEIVDWLSDFCDLVNCDSC